MHSRNGCLREAPSRAFEDVIESEFVQSPWRLKLGGFDCSGLARTAHSRSEVSRCIMSSQIPPQPDASRNSNKAQRLWPPDFSKMDPKHQFRLERRYRRRTKLAFLRPKWTKGVKLAQYGSIACMDVFYILQF